MKSHCHSGGACAGYRVKPGTGFVDPVAGVQTARIDKIKEIWMPAFAGMTPSMLIYEFSHSLFRGNNAIGINQSFPSGIRLLRVFLYSTRSKELLSL